MIYLIIVLAIGLIVSLIRNYFYWDEVKRLKYDLKVCKALLGLNDE